MAPAYFFDEMTMKECEVFLRGMEERERTSWEQTRMMMYAMVQVNCKEEIEPSDVMKFAWDNEESKDTAALDEAAIEALRERAKKFKL